MSDCENKPLDRLTDQHKWEITAVVPDALVDAERVVLYGIDCHEPLDFSNKDWCRHVAKELLEAVKVSMLQMLEKQWVAASPQNGRVWIARLRELMNASECQEIELQMSGAEKAICTSFRETSMQLITELVKKRRRGE